MSSAQKQAAMISNRPDELRLVQQPERLIYEASAPIGTITYGGQDGDQRNALRLVGLPPSSNWCSARRSATWRARRFNRLKSSPATPRCR